MFKSPSVDFGNRSTSVSSQSRLIGILPGEGIGPELISICRNILEVLVGDGQCSIELREGGRIGIEAANHSGRELTDEVIEFCGQIFSEGGAILAGPGGGRFVYNMRKEFDLYVKMNPLTYFKELDGATRLKFSKDATLDIMVVRENGQGLYQGQGHIEDGGKRIRQEFFYTEDAIMRVLSTAVRAAQRRRKRLTVIAKRGGLSEVTRLWFNCAERAVADSGVELTTLDMDYAGYQFIAHPEEFDVVAIPNCFGDILADLGGIFMASRGNTYGASFDAKGNGVFQTNHGSAYDLAGHNVANPAGQIFSLAMLLRDAFGMIRESAWIEESVRTAWRDGSVTADLMQPGATCVGTREMGAIVLENLKAIIEKNSCR